MTLTIKRERQFGKYFWVARQDGKIDTMTKYKRFKSKRSMFDIYKANNSLDPKIKRFKSTNLIETTDLSKKGFRRRYKNEPIQVLARISDKNNNKVVEARSNRYPNKYDPSVPINKMKREAEESVYERLAQLEGLDYEEALGKSVFKNNNYSLEFAIVRYSKR